MDYQALIIDMKSGETRDILMAELSELGFDSFTEDELVLQSFIPFPDFHEDDVNSCLEKWKRKSGFGFRLERIREQNWNAIWESEYEPVIVAGKCMIRAPFHQPLLGIAYDLVIEPRMSFGTAHHETTFLMLDALMNENLNGKRILDQGCGTAVLAILSWKMGALAVDAIDPDQWAYDNALDNVMKNNADGIRVIQGDAKSIPATDYNFILANINRNILLQDMEIYASCLAREGVLFLSGFYDKDLLAILEQAQKYGLRFHQTSSKNHWICVKFLK